MGSRLFLAVNTVMTLRACGKRTGQNHLGKIARDEDLVSNITHVLFV
jgi:hypothetical protein